MDWKEAHTRIGQVEGLISDKEAQLLYSLASACGGTVVEIGSWKGKSTVCHLIVVDGFAQDRALEVIQSTSLAKAVRFSTTD